MFKRPKFEEYYRINTNINELLDGLKMIKRYEKFNPPTSIIWHIERIIHKLKLKIEKLNFFPLWKSMKETSYPEKVGTFFGLLEVIREGFARAIQHERFGEIWVRKR
jgi:chromatin segregation and condensation protein Rec8/ScpA/Scc1 (kleisin family)